MAARSAAPRLRTVRSLAVLTLAVLAAAAVPDAARAQAADTTEVDGLFEPTRTRVGLALEVATPVGAFDEFVDTGWGLGLSLAHDLTADGVLGVRVEGGWGRYGRATRRVPFSFTVPTVFLELDVDNQVGRLTAGPQLALPLGAVRPFVHAGVGISYFTTRSSVEGTDDFDGLDRRREFASTTHFSDVTLALAAGGGLSVRVSRGEHPVGILVSAAYLENGTAEYLRNEDLRRLAEGDLDVAPVTSDTDQVAIRAGVEIGL